MRRLVLVTLVACSEHGQTPPGVDAPGLTPSETPRFVPQICTSGSPDVPGAPNPNCLLNRIPLDVGAEVTFTVQALASGVAFPDMTFRAGEAGLVAVNPKVVINGIATGPETVIDLPPGASASLPSFAIPDAQVVGGMSLRFDSINTQP
jgi:hypothetical protein